MKSCLHVPLFYGTLFTTMKKPKSFVKKLAWVPWLRNFWLKPDKVYSFHLECLQQDQFINNQSQKTSLSQALRNLEALHRLLT